MRSSVALHGERHEKEGDNSLARANSQLMGILHRQQIYSVRKGEGRIVD